MPVRGAVRPGGGAKAPAPALPPPPLPPDFSRDTRAPLLRRPPSLALSPSAAATHLLHQVIQHRPGQGPQASRVRITCRRVKVDFQAFLGALKGGRREVVGHFFCFVGRFFFFVQGGGGWKTNGDALTRGRVERLFHAVDPLGRRLVGLWGEGRVGGGREAGAGRGGAAGKGGRRSIG